MILITQPLVLMTYDKEKRAASDKRYRLANLERYRDVKKQYAINNPGRSYRVTLDKDPLSLTIHSLRSRAKKKGLDFNLDKEDVVAPTYCPLLGIPLVSGKGSGKPGPTPNSPSVDRIDPTKGYVKGNVWVISSKANTIKQSATWQELYQLALNLKAKIESMEDAETTTEEAEHPTE